jgi:hypothetical protein
MRSALLAFAERAGAFLFSRRRIRGIIRSKRLSRRQLRRCDTVVFCYPEAASHSDSVKPHLDSFDGAMRINNESEPE